MGHRESEDGVHPAVARHITQHQHRHNREHAVAHPVTRPEEDLQRFCEAQAEQRPGNQARDESSCTRIRKPSQIEDRSLRVRRGKDRRHAEYQIVQARHGHHWAGGIQYVATAGIPVITTTSESSRNPVHACTIFRNG